MAGQTGKMCAPGAMQARVKEREREEGKAEREAEEGKFKRWEGNIGRQERFPVLPCGV